MQVDIQSRVSRRGDGISILYKKSGRSIRRYLHNLIETVSARAGPGWTEPDRAGPGGVVGESKRSVSLVLAALNGCFIQVALSDTRWHLNHVGFSPRA